MASKVVTYRANNCLCNISSLMNFDIIIGKWIHQQFLNSRTSTNSPSWLDRILSLENITDDILEDLGAVSDVVNKNQSSYSCKYKLESLLGSMCDLSQRPGLMKFLKNAILLLLGVFPRNHILEEAVLVTTQMFTPQENSSSIQTNASRALAKSMLKKDRQVLFVLFSFFFALLCWGATYWKSGGSA